MIKNFSRISDTEVKEFEKGNDNYQLDKGFLCNICGQRFGNSTETANHIVDTHGFNRAPDHTRGLASI